ncbi:hypothetical protein TSA6c_00110 [Azospirillum sp. TSA6c]|uniref:hypothetical protein n=1 Tax=Azospirillum sp. TSA6c TaxID=709813 RepID=UPI000D61C342|nr:hypothetical protein [Azospirillum sp. TSA6c]PWC54683.1 hypothetical protein TSA6c_00110 [Azospirillum sp. TSA6c]
MTTTTEPTFKIGDRVKVKDAEVDRYVSAFAKYIRGRPATVKALPRPWGDGTMMFKGKVQLEWDVKRRNAVPKREWIDQRDVEHLEAAQ